MNAKAKLGVKRRCLTCAAAFLDLNKDPIVCPRCAAVFQVVEYPRSPPRRMQSRVPMPVAPVPAEEVEASSDDDDNSIPLLESEDEDAEIKDVEDMRAESAAPPV
jgi:hypothetical protein